MRGAVAERDWYAVLEVNPQASAEVIAAAYRELAKHHHPDRGGDPARMVELNQARDVLADARLRREYDRARAVRSSPPSPVPEPETAPVSIPVPESSVPAAGSVVTVSPKASRLSLLGHLAAAWECVALAGYWGVRLLAAYVVAQLVLGVVAIAWQVLVG